jgi:NitT/TauT family transport system ATP-binding protein
MAEDIAVSEVSFEYEVAGQNPGLAVRDVSFSLPATKFLCILGPSGCGKTTILNMLAGFLTPTRGDIRIGGQRLNGRQHDRGMVFQDFAQLFPWRTARRNVEFGLEMRRLPKETRSKLALEFLSLVGLQSFANAFPHQLSGGMQQRVAIARSLAYNPGVLRSMQ